MLPLLWIQVYKTNGMLECNDLTFTWLSLIMGEERQYYWNNQRYSVYIKKLKSGLMWTVR